MKLLHEFVFAAPDVGDIVAATDMVPIYFFYILINLSFKRYFMFWILYELLNNLQILTKWGCIPVKTFCEIRDRCIEHKIK